MSLYNDPRYF